MACRRAIWPTNTSPLSSNATTDGVKRPPSSFGMTLGSLPSMIATTEFVVPRSIPMILPMFLCPLFELSRRSEEHTSELQSRPHLVCRLLLEKKKKNKKNKYLDPYIH